MQDFLKDVDAKFADLRVVKSDVTEITLRNGKIKKTANYLDKGFFVRVMNDCWGYATSTDEKSLKSAIRNAEELSKTFKHSEIIEKVVENKKRYRERPKIDPRYFDIEEKVKIVEECYQDAIKSGANGATVKYADAHIIIEYFNIFGAELYSEESRVFLAISAFAKKGDRREVIGEREGGIGGIEKVLNTEIGCKAGKRVTGLLNAEKPPSGKMNVVLDSELASVFVHEAVGHAAEADIVLRGESVFKDMTGTKVAAENVTIVDDGSLKDGFGFIWFDSEGIEGKRTAIIEKGVLRGYMHSRTTASKMKTVPTGNGRAESYREYPIVRMTNTYLEAGDYKQEELLEELKNGIYLCGSRGGEVDTARGLFHFNAEEAYTVKNGELKTHLRDVSLSGDIFSVLKNISAISEDLKFTIGFCGKEGQLVPVGDGAPEILVRDVLVGGA